MFRCFRNYFRHLARFRFRIIISIPYATNGRIFTYIDPIKFTSHVGKYTIHGWYSMVNIPYVGKYSSSMEHLGMLAFVFVYFHPCTTCHAWPKAAGITNDNVTECFTRSLSSLDWRGPAFFGHLSSSNNVNTKMVSVNILFNKWSHNFPHKTKGIVI